MDFDGKVQLHLPDVHHARDFATSEGGQLSRAQYKTVSGRGIDGKSDPSVPRYIAMKQPIFDDVDLDPPHKDLRSWMRFLQPPEKPVTPLALRNPVLMFSESITKAQDIWSFGSLMFEFIIGRMMTSVTPLSLVWMTTKTLSLY